MCSTEQAIHKTIILVCNTIERITKEATPDETAILPELVASLAELYKTVR